LEAEQALDRARASGSADEVRAATTRLTGALRDSMDASRDAAAAAGRLDTAQNELRDSTREVDQAQDQAGSGAEGMGDRLTELGKKAGAAAVAYAGLTSAMDLVGEAMSRDAGSDLLAAQLGSSPQVAKEYGEIAGSLYASGLGDSMEEVNSAIGAVTSSFATLGFEGEASIDQVATRAVNFGKVFGTEVNESVNTASQLVNNGLAKDSTQAFDLMTTAFQRVPAAMRDELPEILNEYGTNFRALGFEGQDAFGLLISAAGQGKFALDKTGDALKEFTIRGSDMSKASTEAYQSIGLDAEAMSQAVAAGGAGAQDALQKTAAGLLGIQDPATRANTAIALFGTPLEDLSVDQIPAFLKGLTGADNVMAGFEGSTDRMSATLNDNLISKLETLKRTIQGGLIDALTAAGEFLMRNADTIKEIGIALAPLAAGLVGYYGGLLLVTGATKAWTAATVALDFVMKMSTIGKVVLLIGLLVGAIIYAYRNFEGFRNVVDAVWQGIQAAFSAAWGFIQPIFQAIADFVMNTLAPALMSFWRDTIQPVFSQIGAIIQTVWTSVIQPVFGFIVAFIQNVLVPVAMFYFNTYKMIFTAVGALIAFVWTSVIKPVFDFMVSLIRDTIVPLFQWFWTGVIQPVFDGIGAVISFWWNNIVRPVFDFMVSLVRDTIVPLFQWFWTGVIQPVFDGIGAIISAWWNNIVQPVFNAAKAFLSDVLAPAFTWLKDSVIQPVMDGIGAVISAVWNNTISPIWELMKSGIAAVGDAFGAAGGAISSMWDGVMNNVKTVAKFIGGILQKVPTKIGPVEIPGGAGARTLGDNLVGWAEGHAQGGFISGAGGPTSDSILARLSDGEFVVRAAVVKRIRPLLEALNAGMEPSRAMVGNLSAGVQSTLGGNFVGGWGVEEDSPIAAALLGAGAVGRDLWSRMPKFAGGGFVSAKDLVDFARGVEGKPYDWGGVNWGDCSGAVSALANYATGQDPFATRFATGNEGSELSKRGFVEGMGPPGSLSIGWTDDPGGPGGGHTAATLPDGTHFEMGGARGNGQFGGQAAGADDDYFQNHMHLPPEAFLGGNPVPAELSGGVGDMGLDYSGGGGTVGSGGAGGGGGAGGSGGGSGSGLGAGGGSAGSGGTGGSSAGATRVFVTNWPGGASPGAQGALNTTVNADPSLAKAAPAGTATPEAAKAAPATGIGAANAWAAEQDFQQQGLDWGKDAVKEIFGPLFEPLGLDGRFGEGVDAQAKTIGEAWAAQKSAAAAGTGGGDVKIADNLTVQTTDPTAWLNDARRMLEDRLAPIAGRYRNGG
jgi:phage-related protein